MTKINSFSPILLVAVLGLASAPASRAQDEELITDRPDQTESTATVEPGKIQVEVGATFTADEQAGVETDSLELPQTLLRIGLSKRTELRLGWSGWQDFETRIGAHRLTADGIGDADVGLKLRLRQAPDSGPELALLVSATVPTGDDGFTSDHVDPAVRLAVSQSISDDVDLGYNLGVEWESEAGPGPEDDDTLADFIYTVATGFGLSDRTGAYVEVFGSIPLSSTGSAEHSFDGGLTFLVKPNVQLDIEAGFGLNSAAPDWFAGLGISFRLPD